MSTLTAPHGLTTEELARSLQRSSEFVEDLLQESIDARIVERTPTGWCLSEWAERRFGRALRGLAGWST